MLFLNKGSLAYIYSPTPIILGRHTEAFILLETVDLWKDQILKASLGDSWVYIGPLECFLEKIFLMIILKPFMADTYPPNTCDKCLHLALCSLLNRQLFLTAIDFADPAEVPGGSSLGPQT